MAIITSALLGKGALVGRRILRSRNLRRAIPYGVGAGVAAGHMVNQNQQATLQQERHDDAIALQHQREDNRIQTMVRDAQMAGINPAALFGGGSIQTGAPTAAPVPPEMQDDSSLLRTGLMALAILLSRKGDITSVTEGPQGTTTRTTRR